LKHRRRLCSAGTDVVAQSVLDDRDVAPRLFHAAIGVDGCAPKLESEFVAHVGFERHNPRTVGTLDGLANRDDGIAGARRLPVLPHDGPLTDGPEAGFRRQRSAADLGVRWAGQIPLRIHEHWTTALRTGKQ
jgi:hypothetical protein